MYVYMLVFISIPENQAFRNDLLEHPLLKMLEPEKVSADVPPVATNDTSASSSSSSSSAEGNIAEESSSSSNTGVASLTADSSLPPSASTPADVGPSSTDSGEIKRDDEMDDVAVV